MMKSREDWLKAGELLASGPGPNAVTIAALCRALNVSKGSFYHHFSKLADYLAELNPRLEQNGHSQANRPPADDKKVAWFELALDILKTDGYAAITLDALNLRMGVTKGAFYYLFKSRDNFIRELLAHWREQTLGEMVDIIQQKKSSGMAAVDEILTLSQQLAHRREIDVQIRAWALSDENVARYQQELDTFQLNACRNIIRHLLNNDDKLVDAAATIAYLSYIGAQQILPGMSEKEWADNLKLFLPVLAQRG